MSRSVVRRRRHGFGSAVLSYLVLAVALAAVIALAVVASGFFYGRSAGERAPELAEYVEKVRPLQDFGVRLRDRFGLVERTEGAKPAKRPADKAQTSSAVLQTTNVVVYRAEVDRATRIADGAFEESPDASAPTVAPPVPPAQSRRRSVDQSLKTFYNGGRKGTPIRGTRQ